MMKKVYTLEVAVELLRLSFITVYLDCTHIHFQARIPHIRVVGDGTEQQNLAPF